MTQQVFKIVKQGHSVVGVEPWHKAPLLQQDIIRPRPIGDCHLLPSAAGQQESILLIWAARLCRSNAQRFCAVATCQAMIEVRPHAVMLGRLTSISCQTLTGKTLRTYPL